MSWRHYIPSDDTVERTRGGRTIQSPGLEIRVPDSMVVEKRMYTQVCGRNVSQKEAFLEATQNPFVWKKSIAKSQRSSKRGYMEAIWLKHCMKGV